MSEELDKSKYCCGGMEAGSHDAWGLLNVSYWEKTKMKMVKKLCQDDQDTKESLSRELKPLCFQVQPVFRS